MRGPYAESDAKIRRRRQEELYEQALKLRDAPPPPAAKVLELKPRPRLVPPLVDGPEAA